MHNGFEFAILEKWRITIDSNSTSPPESESVQKCMDDAICAQIVQLPVLGRHFGNDRRLMIKTVWPSLTRKQMRYLCQITIDDRKAIT